MTSPWRRRSTSSGRCLCLSLCYRVHTSTAGKRWVKNSILIEVINITTICFVYIRVLVRAFVSQLSKCGMARVVDFIYSISAFFESYCFYHFIRIDKKIIKHASSIRKLEMSSGTWAAERFTRIHCRLYALLKLQYLSTLISNFVIS